MLFILIGAVAYGQSEKKKKQRPRADERSLPVPTSLDPNVQHTFEPRKEKGKKSKKSSKGPSYDSEKDYYERKAALEKERRKNERMAEKPQYSDPTYFGHKRPPKRRPPNKMKFCKVCGIRH